jgi:hypothetical protein
MIELNELLRKLDLDTEKTMVMRHRPTERDLRRALRSFAAEKPDLYNAYQSIHGERVEEALSRAKHLASFIGHEAGKAVFVGVYRVDGWREMSGRQWRTLPTSKPLLALGDRGPRDRQLRVFNLVCTEQLADWKGNSSSVGRHPSARGGGGRRGIRCRSMPFTTRVCSFAGYRPGMSSS